MSRGTDVRIHAVRHGLRRGWVEFVQSVRSTQDQWFYLFTAGLTLGYLWIRRDADTGVEEVPLAAFVLPSILAAPRGEYNPSLHLALRIAEFFDVPVELVFSTRPFPRISDQARPA